MAKNKDKRKIPFNVFRKGMTAGALGLAMLFSGAGMLTACGEKGDRGEVGATGKSAYELAVEQGFQGTLNEWLESLKGQSGGSGSAGTDGKGIQSITKTGTNGLVDTYTITFTDGTYTTFEITNGQNGNTPNAPEVTINNDGYWVINGTPTTTKATAENGKTPYIDGEYWYIDGVSTGVKAQGAQGNDGKSAFDLYMEANPTYPGSLSDWLETLKGQDGVDGATWISGAVVPTTEGDIGDYYLNTTTYDIYEKKDTGWTKIGNIKGSTEEAEVDSTKIGDHYMISDGLTDMAANAVEVVVDNNTGIAYACYLASETSLGESSALVKMAKFNILQPTNIEWVTVFNKSVDFSGHALSECNLIDLNSTTVRIFAVDLSTQQYYYKDVNKKTLTVGEKKEVKFKASDNSDAVSFNTSNINTVISAQGGHTFDYIQFTSKIVEVDGVYYTTACGGNAKNNFIFMKSTNGETWTFVSLVNHRVNYEAMLEYHDGKFWVMCRNGGTTPSNNKQQNLLYSEDGITWTQSNLSLETSDTRPYMFTYQGELYMAYSSPLPTNYSTVRNWRCNIHVGKIVSSGGVETFEEVVYKESKFGIVYYTVTDWYGNMILLYSSGELNPTEGLMGGWSQGKDCVNYTILKSEAPELSFKTLSSISITAQPNVTEYAVGDTFNPAGLVVRAKFTDNTYSTVTNYTISSPDMTTAGVKTVTVSYTVNGVTKTVTFDINVIEIEKILQSIEVETEPTKTNYLVNETFSKDGLVVKANYNVGSPVVITNYTLSTPDMTTVGTKTITVTYIEDGVMKTTSFTIEVSEEYLVYKQLGSILVNGSQTLDTGYKPKANTKVVVTLDKPQDSTLTGGKWLFNAGGNKTFGLNIKPSGAYVLDYGSASNANDNRYQTGTINWQEGVNIITFGNGEFKINGGELVTGLSVTTTQTNSAENLLFFTASNSTSTAFFASNIYDILIYEGETLVMHLVPAQRISDNKIGFYDVVGEQFVFSNTLSDFEKGPDLEVKTLTGVEVQSNPTKTEYITGEVFDPSGLVIKVIYDDETYKTVTNYTLSTPDMSTPGTKTITVTYIEGGVTKLADFDITVVYVERVLQAIEVTTNPSKTKFMINQEFSAEGLVVQANYNVGSPVVITNYTLSTPDMTTAGTKTITVTYIEGEVTKTTTFEIVVTELNYNPLTSVVSDGTQYLDTGYKPKANTKVVVKIDKPSDDLVTSTGRWLFNADSQNNSNNSARDFGFNIKSNGAFVLDYANGRTNTGTITWQEGVNTIAIGNGEFTVNGVTFATPAGNPSDAAETLYFLWARSNTTKSYCPAKVYELSIYEGVTLVMHLVPAMNDSGRVGFYDTVSGEFIFSATATDFTEGSEESASALSEITIQENPTITQYAVNDIFNPEGLVVRAIFEDSSYKNITGYTLSTPDMTTAGTKTITVTYELNGVTKTTTFDIVVSDVQKELTSIEIVTNPIKLTYEEGQEFSSEGLIVQANYNVGSPVVITNYTLSTPDMTTVGTKTITVTYIEDGVTKTVEFSITVKEKGYTELSSIVTDGTQYINLGYKVKANTKIVITLDKPDDDKLGNGWLFHAGNNFAFNIKADGAYVLDIGGVRYQTGTINWQEGVNTFTIGNGVFTVNGNELVTGLNVTTSVSNNTADLWLLSASSTENRNYIQTSIYSVAIYEGETLVMNLIPAQRKSDDKVGFYDTINSTYYFSTPAGTNFSAGEEQSE